MASKEGEKEIEITQSAADQDKDEDQTIIYWCLSSFPSFFSFFFMFHLPSFLLLLLSPFLSPSPLGLFAHITLPGLEVITINPH